MKLASRGGIEDAALMKYVIDGIDDTHQNKMILYASKNLSDFKDSLKAYERMRRKIHQPVQQKSYALKNVNANQSVGGSKDRCFNCGIKGHKSADCKKKDQGVKCFKCNAFGHYAKNCPSAQDSQKANTRYAFSTDNRMMKVVNMRQLKLNALFDTGSKFNLITESIFYKLKETVLLPTFVRLVGFGNKDRKNDVKPLGSMQCPIQIDGEAYDAEFLVVPNEFMDFEMVIGENFCTGKEVTIDSTGVHFKQKASPNDVAEVLMIEDIFEKEEFDIDHGASKQARKKVHEIINNYHPKNMKTTGVEMKITLHDETPIFSRPHRLPFVEKQVVDKQVAKWLEEDIIEPSESEFCSSVVLVKKKMAPRDYVSIFEKLIR